MKKIDLARMAQNLRSALILLAVFVFAVSAQRVPLKNVAIVEVQIDAASGIGKDINKAEVRVITTEIRRAAVNILPRDRYSVMTSESILAMSAEVLEDCAEENCVITLGSKIGADYVVRGTISKFGKDYSLSVEMFDTEYGMLVASADLVRATSLSGLLKRSAVACNTMYKNFLEASLADPAPMTALPAQTPGTSVTPTATNDRPKPNLPAQTTPRQKTSPLKLTLRISTAAIGVGGIIGGVIFNDMADNEYEEWRTARPGSQAEADAKTNTDNYKRNSNLLFALGGVGLTGFALTFFF